MKHYFRIFILLLACLFTTQTFAKDVKETKNAKQAKDVGTKEAADIKTILQKRFPKLEITTVTKTPYFGLYEAVVEGQLVYTDTKAQFLFQGNIFELATLKNLTKEKADKLSAVDFNNLPFDLAIKNVKGNGKRQVAVFSDPDCPYCKQLEKTLANVSDVTIYTFLLPLEGLHPDAPRKAQAVWCSENKVKAWDELMLNGVVPPVKECETPIATIGKLARKHRINGTPTVIFASGQTVPGAVPAADFEKMLDEPAKIKETAK